MGNKIPDKVHLLRQLLIQLFFFIVFFALLEGASYLILLHLGINPLDKVKKYPYGRTINGFYATENLPDHAYHAFDGLDNFKPGVLVSNKYSFFSDEPLHINKDSSVIRIFLTGGSTAFGSIESQSVTHDKSYPAGCYTYTSSIAGLLKANLSRRFPGKHFEVVNCAVVAHRFCQNYLMYYAAIQKFHPDIIINMDGFNEGYAISGIPFEDPAIKKEMNGLMELQARSKYGKFPFTVFLMNYLLDAHTERLNAKEIVFGDKYKLFANYATFLVKKLGVSDSSGVQKVHQAFLQFYKQTRAKQSTNSDTKQLRATMEKQLYAELSGTLDSTQMTLLNALIRDPTYEGYKLLEPLLIDNSQSLQWLIASYENQLKQDGVHSIFCLQPMLSRRVYQKELSPLELQLRKNIEINSPTRYDCTYFFDTYFSPQIDSIVQSSDATYIDMNKEITNLRSSDEFYVDYCHLTPFGNRFVAGKFAELVDDYLRQTQPL